MAQASNTDSNPLVRFGAEWNRFWFAPQDAYPLAVLRVAVGLLTLYWLLSWTPDLIAFFGPGGLVSTELVDQFSGEGSIPPSWLSYLSLVNSPTELYILHAIGILVVAAFTAGVFTRITNVAALVVVVSYVHRVEFLTTQSDTLLVILLFYLCLGPSGRCLSFDRWRADKARSSDPLQDVSDVTWTATPSLRLIQIHLTLFYVILLLSQLTASYYAGQQTIGFPWLEGTAVWWLAARPDSRMVDLTGLLGSSLILINAVTHLLMMFEVVLIGCLWKRSLRHWVLLASIPYWLLLTAISGLGLFAALMCVAGVAFVDPQLLRRLLRPVTPQPSTEASESAPARRKSTKAEKAAT